MEEFKRGINGVIKRKLIKEERSPTNIEQWYQYATNIYRYWRKSQREEKKLKSKKKSGN